MRIRRVATFDQTLDQLWRLISDPARLGEWLVDDFDVEMRVGGSGTAVDGDRRRRVEIDRIDARRRVEFTWRDDDGLVSTVALDIEATPAGASRLVITERLLPHEIAGTSARLAADDRRASVALAWEVRVLSLWACTVAMALVQ